MTALQLSPIGIISSCYKEKFGIPRQPGLVPAAMAELILGDEFGEESVRGLEGFSHIWINFIFHETQAQGWKPMVRPPRLGGNEKVGVFASRSTFRPNPIGLSAVELLCVEIRKGRVVLHLAGCDLLDGTPVLDIKPYLPYADIIPNAGGGFAETKPEALLEVVFSEEAELQCKQADQRIDHVKVGGCASIKVLITQVLQLDPRPAYQSTNKDSSESDRIYAMKLHDFDLKWRYYDNNKIKVLALEKES
ncbi:MAG: tRNA (N6-threonylcarbamoyladenosine(37)-N6)-methyltransferase TrmO [Cocleimonas sp.]|nr:tRNA (N6-threonylcarbamoyladenosine(37)-N6)-methyltransferase TrmO [Cocleimonas sp.]